MTRKQTTADHGPVRFYGRRRGHALRPGRRQLVDALLPKLRVAIPADGTLDPSALFEPAVRSVWMEIGFGGGEHLAAQAAAHPDVGFIGCEPFVNGVARLLAEIEARGLGNVRIHDDDARLILPALPDASVDRVFLLFLDPWPKTRHHRRRFVSDDTVAVLARILRDGGEVRFASDHTGYVAWALEHVTRNPAFRWTARRPADWRERPPDAVETRYESKARRRGAGCAYLTFERVPRHA